MVAPAHFPALTRGDPGQTRWARDAVCGHSTEFVGTMTTMSNRADRTVTPDGDDPIPGGKTLDRGIRLLQYLMNHPRGRTLTDIARDMEMNRTAAHRIVETLTAHALVTKDEDKRVRLGPGLVQLASGVDMDLRRLSRPVLQDLADETRSTVHLEVAVGAADAQPMLVIEPQRSTVHLAYRPGRRHPIGVGSGGIAILAHRDPAEGDAANVVEARRLGYARSRGELIPSVTGVSVGVTTPAHLPETSIGLSLFDDDLVEDLAPILQSAAARLERVLNQGF